MSEEKFDEQVNEIQDVAPEEALNVEMGTVAEEDAGGIIQISKLALLSVVKKYVLDVEGVIRFQNQSLMDGMLDILSSKRSERSIIIETPESGAEITVTVVMRFGVRIPDVAHEIQRVLREKIEELTGYQVAKVNVNVSDLEEIKPVEAPKAEKAEETEQAEGDKTEAEPVEEAPEQAEAPEVETENKAD